MRMCNRGNPRILLMLLSFLQISWRPSIYVQFVRCQGESIPVRLDCGGDSTFLDSITNLTWVPDSAYMSTGLAATSCHFSGSAHGEVLPRELRTLRYFDITTPRKNCYTFIVTRRPYLIRAGFFSSESDLGAFQLALDSTLWAVVNMSGTKPLYYEAITAPPTQDTLHVCLIRTSSGRLPFINSLELHPLDSGAYTDSPLFGEGKHHLYLLIRANFGEQSSTWRWPDDPYERVWPPYATLPSLTVSSNVVDVSLESLPEGACSTRNRVPGSVMQTAIMAPNITYTISDLLPERLVYGIQYFCELDASLSSEQRRTFLWLANFSHIIPEDPSVTAADRVTLDGPFTSSARGYVIARTGTDATITLKLTTDPSSQLSPILNAGEVYYVEPVADSTDDKDGEVLQMLKRMFGLSHWLGDPCLPVPWDELSSPPCSNNAGEPVRVQSLDLSRKNLSGPIPPAIRKLQMLTSLRLNNNRFGGKLPELNFSGLVILDVSNNQLRGPFPSWLKNPATLSNLQELDISNNDLTGTFPAELIKRLGSRFRYSGNKQLTCEDAGSGLCTKDHQRSALANIGPIAGGVAGGICVLLVILVMAISLRIRFQKISHASRSKQTSETRLDDMSDSLYRVGAKARSFSLDTVKEITENFSRRLGQGGFGPVYYGQLQDGQEVAVKILSTTSHQGHQEFLNEIELLSVIHHKNLVSLVGYCKEGPELILLYEYMSGGDLRARLQHSRPDASTKTTNELSWKTRLDVALGAAAGLEYLHHGCRPGIIHRDVKSSNILLNMCSEAKMADFGLSKRGPLKEELESHVTTNVKGTTGYLDPEYMMSGQLTDKSDVYSFGVVLLEILTGRTPVFVGCDIPVQERGMNIIDWVTGLLRSGNLAATMDPSIAQCYNVEAAWRTADVALRCVEKNSKDRPDMHEVVRELNQAMDLEMGRNGAYSTFSAKVPSDSARPYAMSSPIVRSPMYSLGTEGSLERTSHLLVSQVFAR